MKKFVMAALGGTVAGALLTTQIAGPLLAQEAKKSTTVYEQLDLFGDHARQRQLEQTLDAVASKFGAGSMKRARDVREQLVGLCERVEVALTLLANGAKTTKRTIETSDAPQGLGHEPQGSDVVHVHRRTAVR